MRAKRLGVIAGLVLAVGFMAQAQQAPPPPTVVSHPSVTAVDPGSSQTPDKVGPRGRGPGRMGAVQQPPKLTAPQIAARLQVQMEMLCRQNEVKQADVLKLIKANDPVAPPAVKK